MTQRTCALPFSMSWIHLPGHTLWTKSNDTFFQIDSYPFFLPFLLWCMAVFDSPYTVLSFKLIARLLVCVILRNIMFHTKKRLGNICRAKPQHRWGDW
jgi:hypothetical protein